MLIDKTSLLRRAFVVAAISAFAATGTSPCRALPANAQQDVSPPSAPVMSTYQSHSSEEDHAHSEATHRYSSEADRAKDALVITEVKTALANDGVTDGHAVVVDCDHGIVLLAGAIGSAADAQHAVAVASSVDGVLAVKNHLKWWSALMAVTILLANGEGDQVVTLARFLVTVDNISITANYRNQFNRVINDQGFDAFDEWNASKQQELLTSLGKWEWCHATSLAGAQYWGKFIVEESWSSTRRIVRCIGIAIRCVVGCSDNRPRHRHPRRRGNTTSRLLLKSLQKHLS